MAPSDGLKGSGWRCTRGKSRHPKFCTMVRPAVLPRPTSIRISISGRDAQRPYGLIRPHHVCSQPRQPVALSASDTSRYQHFGRPNSPGLQAQPLAFRTSFFSMVAPWPIFAMSVVVPVPREPATPAVLHREAVAPAHEGWPGNRSQPDARHGRTRGNRRRIRAQMSGYPRPSSRYRNGCTPNVSRQTLEAVSLGSGGRNPHGGQ